MSVLRALAFLWVHSAKNRIASRLRRFRQPKYLVGGIVGGLYLGLFVFRTMLGGRFGPTGEVGSFVPPETWRTALETGGAWLLLGMLVGFWILPSRRAALDFSEAEIQFLFPAPVSRRGLLHYKLAGWQAGLLFTSVMASFFSGRLLRGDGAWMAVVGWWMVFLLLQLHSLGASFVRTWLLDRGIGPWKRRLAVATLAGGTLAGAVAWGWSEAPSPPGDPGDVDALAAWGLSVSQTRPLREILTPLRWVTRLATTHDRSEFARSLVFVIVAVALHYVWVMRAAVAFEEATVEAARASVAAEASAAKGKGTNRSGTERGRASLAFPLKPEGPPWVALAWKNVASLGDWFRGPRLAWGVAVLLLLWGAACVWARETAGAAVVGGVAAMVWVLAVFLGPTGARIDLRQDLAGKGWEVLRSLPLRGWQVVIGELAAPWGLLAAVQWGLALCVVGWTPAPPDFGEFGWRERGWTFVAMASFGPAVSLLGLSLQNAATLWFPAWMVLPAGARRGGFEVLGQQMLVYVGQVLALALGLMPAVIAGALLYAVVGWFGGVWVGMAMAAMMGAAVLIGEAALLVLLMGYGWERADFSTDSGG